MSHSRSISWNVSTETVPDAFERYVFGMADLYEISGVSEHDRRYFYNNSRSTLTEAGAIGYGRSVRQTLSRSPATLRRSDVDGLNLIVNRAAVVGDADGREVRAAPGAIQMRDLSRPAASRLDEIDLVTLIAPRTVVPAGLLSRGAHGEVIAPDRPGARLLSAHLVSLEQLASSLSGGEVEAAIQAALMVAARVVGFDAEFADADVAALQNTVRRAAKAHVEKRLTAGDAAVTSDALARAAGVSRTTLYRAFDVEGGVSRYIQERRLHHARRALRQRKGATPTIADIAFQHGFASQSHFSRQFRVLFGYSPSEVAPLQVPRDLAMSPAVMSEGPIRHDILVDWLKTLQNPPEVV